MINENFRHHAGVPKLVPKVKSIAQIQWSLAASEKCARGERNHSYRAWISDMVFEEIPFFDATWLTSHHDQIMSWPSSTLASKASINATGEIAERPS